MSESRNTRLQFPATGIALLLLDQPGKSVNLLSSEMLEEIDARLEEISTRSDLQGLIIASAKPGSFIAGADLAEFVAGLSHPKEEIVGISERGQNLFGQLSQLPFVTIAAIDGICVGGGAELAVWCDRRIVTRNEKTNIGFPEVKLGLFPGWGGTARTPRIIGLANAVELITTGESIDAAAAYKLGLADDLVPVEDLQAAAIRMVRAERESKEYLADRKQREQSIAISETELGFLGATASAVIQQQTHGQYPAPLAALELMLEASQVDLQTACTLEAERFAALFGSPVNRALLNVFFLQDRNKKAESGKGKAEGRAVSSQLSALSQKKDPAAANELKSPAPSPPPPSKAESGKGKADKESTLLQPLASSLQPLPKSVGIVGAGIMGQGIASANLRRGFGVKLTDSRPEALAAAAENVIREAAYNKQTKQADLDAALRLASQLQATPAMEEIAKADLVIEAIIEDEAAKRHLFHALESNLSETALLCTNTSTIPIATLSSKLKHPERFCGLHFFNPVRKMQLVEVIRGPQTSDATVATAVAYARKLGKSPIVVGDGPGFLVNRLLFPYMNEAAILLSEGVPVEAIEKAALKFGLPMGPFTLYDVVGLDTCLHAGRTMAEAFPDRVVAPPIVERLVEAGRLGQKNGKGFFDYTTDSKGRPKAKPSAEVAELVKRSEVGGQRLGSEIADRLILPMLLEATRVVEEKLVADVRDVDLALILGIGFPPFKGGLFFWADTLGPAKIIEKLQPYIPLGKRYEPTPLLLSLAKQLESFY